MIFYELKDNLGDIVLSTIGSQGAIFREKEKENCSIDKFRQVYREYPHGSVRIIGDIGDEFIATGAIASRTCKVYSELIDILKDIKKKQEIQYSIFSHNLITTHSRLQDEIESIISEEKLAGAENYFEQTALIKNAIESDKDGVSESIFEMAKRIIDLQAQITGFKILSGEIKPDIKSHNIKKVLLNMLYPYYDDLKAREIETKIYIGNDEAAQNLVLLDYKVFNIALHHFLNNVVKYAYPGSHVDVRFDWENSELSFDMISLKIDENEIDDLFNLNVSGVNSAGLSGDGIGMFMLKKALGLLGFYMEIVPDYSVNKSIDNRLYTKNTFYIKLKNNS